MRALAAVLILITLPAAWVAFDAVSFHQHNATNGSLTSAGERREYLLYVPPTYDRSKPAPLVISLHGAGGWPGQQRDVSGWNRLAEREGFLVVYPAAVRRPGPRIWRVARTLQLENDVRFVSDLIDELRSRYNIDPRRIYADGLSNGGAMAFVLSCTMPDRLAAVGMVAAAQTLPWRWCTDPRPMPMIAFHGTDDRIVPYAGGVTWISPRVFPDVAKWTEKWAQRNRCDPHSTETAVRPDVVRRAYENCANGADVVLYTLRGGGHTWPGGGPLPEWFVGPTSHTIDATSETCRFFLAHPRAE